MEKKEPRDVFPQERMVALEARVDGHDREFKLVHDLIDALRHDQHEARVEHREEQQRTRLELGEKVDAVVRETHGVRTEVVKEVAGVRTDLTATRDDLQGFKRFVAGVVAAVGFLLPIGLYVVAKAFT